MIDKLSNFLRHQANRRNIFIFLALFILMNALILPWAGGRIEAYSGGVGPIDLEFWYTPERVYEMIAAYGDQGRSFYLVFELIGDTAYPIIYGGLFALWITFFLQRSFSLESGVQKLHLLPVAVMVVDFLENVAIMIMLAAYPTQLTAVAQAATLFTALKWLLFAATVAATLFALIMWGIRRFIPVGSIAH
jgi:hypothetical protein